MRNTIDNLTRENQARAGIKNYLPSELHFRDLCRASLATWKRLAVGRKFGRHQNDGYGDYGGGVEGPVNSILDYVMGAKENSPRNTDYYRT